MGQDSDSGSADNAPAGSAGSSSSGGNNDEQPPPVHSVDLSKPPGHFQLLFDEETGFEYKSDKRLAAEARKEAKKTAAATATTTAATTPAATTTSN